MIFYKVMPVIDLFAVAMLLFGAALPAEPVRIAGMYLVAKGIFFVLISKDVASIGDFIFGIYALSIAFFGFYNLLISIIGAAYLGQKALFALAAS